MAFTSRDYSAKFASIQERVSVAGRPLLENMWTAEHGAGGCQYDVHVSMHFDRVSDTSWNVGARGAITSICISEYEPLDMRTDVPVWARRSDIRTRYSCAIYFFADGKTMYCSEGTRDCYRAAAEAWLEEVRASTAVTPDPVSGGEGGA